MWVYVGVLIVSQRFEVVEDQTLLGAQFRVDSARVHKLGYLFAQKKRVVKVLQM